MTAKIHEVKKELSAKFDIKDLGRLSYFPCSRHQTRMKRG